MVKKICFAFLVLYGIGTARNRSDTDGFPREQTLSVTGWQWEPPSTFNPLHSNPMQFLSGQVMLAYETPHASCTTSP
ncbi:MAG: hypothetical protein JW795_06310 [Chitinivibrionales bacterium]|nr:hypothetical protein [Chitinivibrionales bacterium]